MTNDGHKADFGGMKMHDLGSQPEPLARMVEQGFLPQDVAIRISGLFGGGPVVQGMTVCIPDGLTDGQAKQGLAGSADHTWSVTRLKKNPGRLLSEAALGTPQVIVDGKRKGARPVVAIDASDLFHLVEAAMKAAGPGYATGRDMHARLARSGPPLAITEQGLPRRRQSRMSITVALDAQPEPHGGTSRLGKG